MRLLRSLLRGGGGGSAGGTVEVSSVDGFQGREKEIILFSCVRSDRGRDWHRGVGFLRDARRINVSMTRAKYSVFVLGHAATLKGDPLWEAMMQDAEDRDCLLKAHSPIGIWFEAACKEKRAPPDAAVATNGEAGEAAVVQVAKPGTSPAGAEGNKRRRGAASNAGAVVQRVRRGGRS